MQQADLDRRLGRHSARRTRKDWKGNGHRADDRHGAGTGKNAMAGRGSRLVALGGDAGRSAIVAGGRRRARRRAERQEQRSQHQGRPGTREDSRLSHQLQPDSSHS
jgi:hypothetical protein